MHVSYLVGQQLKITVTVKDEATKVAVDPGTFRFTVKPPGGGLAHTYEWNGTSWVNSESVIGVPSKTALGTFVLLVTLPYSNASAGAWACGWKSTKNVGGLGEGSGETTWAARATNAL